MVDGGEPGVDSRDEGKHTGRNDVIRREDDVVVCLSYSTNSPKRQSSFKR